jgi:hypothetical protein
MGRRAETAHRKRSGDVEEQSVEVLMPEPGSRKGFG